MFQQLQKEKITFLNSRVNNLKIIKEQSAARHFLMHKIQQKYDYMIKLIVVGDSGIGKTNIISAFSNPQYQYTNIHVPTIGVDFSSKIIQVENKKIKLQVWDTAGQERFRTITETYYKGAAGILLVYSVANRQSFNNIRKWMQSIQQRINQSTKIMLIANKTDLPDEQKQNLKIKNDQNNSKKYQSYRIVSKKQGWDLATQYNIPYHEVSAKMNLKIDQIFYNISQMINIQIEEQNQRKQTQSGMTKLSDERLSIKQKYDKIIKLDDKHNKFIKLKTANGITYHKRKEENQSQNENGKSTHPNTTMKNCAC